MNEIVILKDEELLVLLAAAGVKELYGYQQDGGVDESKIPYLIHELARAGVIQEKREELVISEPYLSIIKGLRDAKAVLTIKIEEERENITYIIYIGTNFVVMFDSINDKNAVKLFLADKDIIAKFLDEYFCAEKQLVYPEKLIMQSIQEEDRKCKTIVNLTELRKPHIENENRVFEWFLYESKYKYFVKIVQENNTVYMDYRDWKHSEIIEVINKVIGAGVNDID